MDNFNDSDLNKTVLWFTGLPCSGKTTLAKRLNEELKKIGYNPIHLDGDDVRNKLNSDLGFSEEDRYENLRRIAHVAELLNNKSGNLVIAAFITPTNKIREMVKGIVSNYKLIYIQCGIEECEKRDVKEMYKKAREGKIKKFTGIDSPFEEPQNPDLIINTEKNDIENCVSKIIGFLNS